MINYLPIATNKLWAERKDIAVIASALILLYMVNFKYPSPTE
jgi:hypothetical protein